MQALVEDVQLVADIGGDLEGFIESAELPFDVEVPNSDYSKSEDEEIVAIVLGQVTEGFEKLEEENILA